MASIKLRQMPERWQEHTRAKIASSCVVSKLINHVKDAEKHPMLPTQVTVALGLLRKVVPDLSATELSGGVASYVARLPTPAVDATAWAKSIEDDSPTLAQPTQALDKPLSNKDNPDEVTS